MLGDPFASTLLNGDRRPAVLFEQVTVVLDLAYLFDHARTKQSVFVSEGNTY